MDNQNSFKVLRQNYKNINYLGGEIKINHYNVDKRSDHENVPKIIELLENLNEFDKKARYYLIKSLENDGELISYIATSVMEEGDSEAVFNMTPEEFVDTLAIGDIDIYVDSPEDEIYAYCQGGILSYYIEPTTTDESIHVVLRYVVADDGCLFGEWELLSMFNLVGESVQSYFNKQH